MVGYSLETRKDFVGGPNYYGMNIDWWDERYMRSNMHCNNDNNVMRNMDYRRMAVGQGRIEVKVRILDEV